jgi:hypothetical protein
VAKQNSYTLQERHTVNPWADNQVTRVRLPLSGYLTHMDGLITLNTTEAGAVVPAEDAFARIVRSIRIKSSGARSFVDFTDGRQWKYYSWFQYRGQIQIDAIPTGAGGPGNHYANFPLHLGMFPNDPFDTSVVIPSVETTDLIMEVTWGAAADIQDVAGNLTINSAELKLLIYEIALAPGEKRSLIWKKGLVMPRFEPRIIPVSQAYANLGLVSDLPVGDTLHRTVVMTTDKSVDTLLGTRTYGKVSEIGVKFPKMREIPWERDYRQFAYEAQRKYDLAAPVVGTAQIDGLQLSGRAIGLDLTRAVTGDAQYAFTTNAAPTGDIQMLHYLMS